MTSPSTGDAFERLRRLLDGVEPPAGLNAVALHLGEQRLAVPSHLLSVSVCGDDWSRYPVLGGTTELRASYIRWLLRRCKVDIDPNGDWIDVEPMPGAKYAIATAIKAAVNGRSEPIIVMPDPCYPTYVAAANLCGAKIVGYPADTQDPTPTIEQLIDNINPISAIIICNPNNPTGYVIKDDAFNRIRSLAIRHNALLIFDECYIDLWISVPPASYTTLLSELPRASQIVGRWVVVHSLSKRSAAPGLRSAFVAGDIASIAMLRHINRTCGVSLGNPIATLSAALWDDEAHVDQMRSSLRSIWELAESILGDLPCYQTADAGFFLWLPVGNGIETARRLWGDAGIKVMPGTYLSAGTPAGQAADQYIRVALTLPPATLGPALNRIKLIVA
jgi:N-succinyldiaminopimelate aminotransferase